MQPSKSKGRWSKTVQSFTWSSFKVPGSANSCPQESGPGGGGGGREGRGGSGGGGRSSSDNSRQEREMLFKKQVSRSWPAVSLHHRQDRAGSSWLQKAVTCSHHGALVGPSELSFNSSMNTPGRPARWSSLVCSQVSLKHAQVFKAPASDLWATKSLCCRTLSGNFCKTSSVLAAAAPGSVSSLAAAETSNLSEDSW